MISNEDKSLTKYVFGRLVGKLGLAFASQLSDKRIAKLMTTEWAVGMKGLNVDDVNRGLDLVSGSFAPSLPDFVLSCRAPINLKSHQPFVPRPKTLQDKELAGKALSDMKRGLK